MTTRHHASATSISWIPSEAVRGMGRLPFDRGLAHYDEPPPEQLHGPSALDDLRDSDRFRFANVLDAWIDVDDGVITGWGQGGGGQIGATTLAIAGTDATFAAVPFEDVVPDPEVTDSYVRFRQTAGGRTGVPMPRRVNRPPFVQIAAPAAWSTIEVTLHADGRSECRLAGASPFPRHWMYDSTGALASKSGTIDYRQWYRQAFGASTPWGDVDRDVVTGELESPLERAVSTHIMQGDAKIKKLKAGHTLIHQGEDSSEMYLLLDGVVSVVVDDATVAELGPGAVLGERAAVEGGHRTATITARTRCRLAVTSPETLAADVRHALSSGHRREDERTT